MIDHDLSTNPFKNPAFSSTGTLSLRESKDKKKLRSALTHKHMIETIERFKWLNLPDEITPDMIERTLYHKFKGCFFKYLDAFWFLPFTLSGTIDPYGRYEGIVPVLWEGVIDKKTKKETAVPFLPVSVINTDFKVVYNKKQVPTDYNAVILTDSSLEISQDWIPMKQQITPFIDQMVDIMVLLNIDLVTSAKVFYIVAQNKDQKEAIEDEFRDLDTNILDGKRVVVVTSDIELRELTGGNSQDSSRYMQAFQSVDNIRKSIIGMDNAGAFLKQEHMTIDETETNSQASSAVLSNSLRMRQEFCELVNHAFGLNIGVELNCTKDEEIVGEESSQTEQLNGNDGGDQ